jgi:hypothetical protein
MPTKHTSELLSARAATMVIISVGVQVEGAGFCTDMGKPSAFVSLDGHAACASDATGEQSERIAPMRVVQSR